jgi:hypothetical protein
MKYSGLASCIATEHNKQPTTSSLGARLPVKS